jgi:hypothetical protein
MPQVIFQRIAWRVEVNGVRHTIVTLHDTKLEAGRPGVHDKYSHLAVLALVGHIGFGRGPSHQWELG